MRNLLPIIRAIVPIMSMTLRSMIMTIPSRVVLIHRILIDQNLEHPSTAQRMAMVIKVNMSGMERTITPMVAPNMIVTMTMTMMTRCGDCILSTFCFLS